MDDANRERLDLEQSLHDLLGSIPPGPRSAFQMYAQGKLDDMGLQGPLPDNIDPEGMQKQLVEEFNALSSAQQAHFQAQGNSKFQSLMRSAHENIREVRDLTPGRRSRPGRSLLRQSGCKLRAQVHMQLV